MVVMVFGNVVLRYAFNSGITVSEELSRWLFVWMTFMGAVVALKDHGTSAPTCWWRACRQRARRPVPRVSQLLMLGITGCSSPAPGADQDQPGRRGAGHWRLDGPGVRRRRGVRGAVGLVPGADLWRAANRVTFGDTLVDGAPVPSKPALTGQPTAPGQTTHPSMGLIHDRLHLPRRAAGAMALGVPIAYALLVSGVALMWHLDMFDAQILAQNVINGADSFPLLAVPFFMLAGEIMNVGGLSRRIVNLALTLVGHLRGGLGFVTILAAVLMAALSGSAVADTAAWPRCCCR
jgi:hypothetical protein